MERDAKASRCECWFLDVGQGTSNVILLGESRAIVIDCGPHGSVQTSKLLERWADTIEILIVSHNDSDHDHNVASILGAFPKAVKKILLLEDRNVGLIKTFGLLSSEQSKNYPRPERLESDGSHPKIIFSENDITLSIMYPDLTENLNAQGMGTRRPNATSGILKLECGTRKVVFSGDATIEAWESLASRINSSKPLSCDIMTIPHHGGSISAHADNERASQIRLYSEIIKPKYGIISVGTRNERGHPTQEAIAAAMAMGVKILCTQMTGECCYNLESIRSRRKIINKPSRSSAKEDRSSQGHSRNVACFGSVVAEISPSQVNILNIAQYKQDVEKFSTVPNFQPLCNPFN